MSAVELWAGRKVRAGAEFHGSSNLTTRFLSAQDRRAFAWLNDDTGDGGRAGRITLDPEPCVLFVSQRRGVPRALVKRRIGMSGQFLPATGLSLRLGKAAWHQQHNRKNVPHAAHVTTGRFASQGGRCA